MGEGEKGRGERGRMKYNIRSRMVPEYRRRERKERVKEEGKGGEGEGEGEGEGGRRGRSGRGRGRRWEMGLTSIQVEEEGRGGKPRHLLCWGGEMGVKCNKGLVSVNESQVQFWAKGVGKKR